MVVVLGVDAVEAVWLLAAALDELSLLLPTEEVLRRLPRYSLLLSDDKITSFSKSSIKKACQNASFRPRFASIVSHKFYFIFYIHLQFVNELNNWPKKTLTRLGLEL